MPKHVSECFCPMGGCNHKHKEEWECKENCPEHGPFPTKWTLHLDTIRHGGPSYHPNYVEWSRYIGPFQTEIRQQKIELTPPKD